MNATLSPGPGDVLAWWDGHDLSFGMVVGEAKQRLRIISARGREERVRISRVAAVVRSIGTGDALDASTVREEVGKRVERVAARVRERAAGVDVGLIWEIVSESGSAPRSVEELTELAFDEREAENRAALLVALLEDRFHFFRRGDEWEPRTPEAIDRLRQERERVAERARQSEAFFSALAELRRDGEYRRQETAEEKRHLDALEQVAIHEDATSEAIRAMATEALKAAGFRYDRPHEGAFRLLRRLGRFESDDENLQLLRYQLRSEFPAEVLEHARQAAERRFDREGRTDLTALEAVSIDGATTREIDDALSVEPREGGGWRVDVHISDPSEIVKADDPVDREALARAVTHYMPDRRLTMLPAAISENAASLVEGEERPALSFRVTLDDRGEIEAYELTRSVVRCRTRLDYEQADRAVTEGGHPLSTMLGMLATVGECREQARRRTGAIPLHAPEVDVHVDPDGRPWLERLSRDSPSRRAVTEAMVLAGEVAARFCVAERLPAIYRRQSVPDRLPEIPAEGVRDAVAVRRVRRCLKRAEIGLQPAPHASLGLLAYVQVTSPLRRYQDLAVHRQIIARLCDEPPAYDAEAMQRIAATTERADADARRAERASDDYWLLRYLERFTGSEVEGIVVDTQPRPIVQLLETLREVPMPSLAGCEPGTPVRLHVERVNPRAGLLALRRVD